MELSPLEAARKLAPQIRSCADEIEAQRELPRPLFEALADAGIFHMAVPQLHRRRRGRPADLHPGDRGARQGRREHRLVREPGRDLRDLRLAHAARDGAPHLDRHAPCGRGQHAGGHGQGDRGPGRLSRDRAPGVQHGLPARVLGGRPRADHRERPGPDGGQRAGDALHVRAGRRGAAARHLARARHAGHRHPSLRGRQRLRAGRAHGALGDGAAAGGPAALPHPAHAAVRLRRRLGGVRHGARLPEHVHGPGRRQGPARHARTCCATSRWCR